MSKLPKRTYQALVKDLFAPRQSIFLADFLLSYAGFIGALALFLLADGWLAVPGFAGAVFLSYRCASFIHEIVHLPRKGFGLFKGLWNALFGVPFMMPSFFYESHLDHHIPRKYGTKNDPEYLPLSGMSVPGFIGFVLEHAIGTPMILFARLLVGLPVRLFWKDGASVLDRRFSSLVINRAYEKPTRARTRALIAVEAQVLIGTVVVATLVVQGVIPLVWIGKIFAVFATGLVANVIRTLCAHRYQNHSLERLDEGEQFADSLNYEGNPVIGGLMAPVGLRFHALHHLFPTIPYHNLAEAHRRLMAGLPLDDPYRRASFRSFTRQLGRLMGERGNGRPVAAE
ncbi:fatty acid desaturase family protein [Yunchengibacter salinarum]|uniref:fatty acid desaturase family protein n=1 Tax=Yunchengibacter salinarum TaxID=3133399 RepID=UPI0035B5AEC4